VQPGWTEGPFNTWYFRSGAVSLDNPPRANIGPVDPDGTDPPPPDDDMDLPPGQRKRPVIVVRPGNSIHAAVDWAAPGPTIYILAGV
jgi:hypothetical protein